MIVEEGKGCLELAADTPAEVTLRCDRTTFALLFYSRLTLDAAVAQGCVTVAGDHALAQVLAQSLTPYFSAPRMPQA